jgi:uncharacterized protein (TIRG00374 family)
MGEAQSRGRMLGIGWRDAAGFALSAGLLWLTWHRSGIAEEGLQVEGDAWFWLLCAMAVFLASLGVHVMRAHLLWKDNSSITYATVAKSLFIGNFFNVVLPGNLGEAVRAWHFHRRARVGFWESVAGILTEKFVDAQLYALALVLLFVLWFEAWAEPVFVVLFAVWFGIAAVNATLLLFRFRPAVEKMAWALVPGKVVRRSLFRAYRHLFAHVTYLRGKGCFWPFFLQGYVMLGLSALQYYFVLKAAGLHGPINGLDTVFLIAMVMVVINVTPSAPGSAGVVHYGIFATLTLAAELQGLPQQGAAFAMAGVHLHLSYFLPESFIGAWLVWSDRALLTDWRNQG